jgi:predicted nucleotidyltransferase
MSARDLAAASGLSASTVTRIERGEMNPTVTTLERLLEASGSELVISERPRTRTRPTLAALRRHRAAIDRVLAAHDASNPRVFGSVARGDSRPDSDIDLLIDVPRGTGLIAIGQIEDELNDLLPWRVDVVGGGAARGRMDHIADEAIPL